MEGLKTPASETCYFQTGKYVADTRLQGEHFAPAPKIDASAGKMLADFGVLPGVAGDKHALYQGHRK